MNSNSIHRGSPPGQRQLMGPPETPSRGMLPPSPGLFSSLQFSPDMFAPPQQAAEHQQQQQQHMSIHPQQRLFWDPATATPMHCPPQQFHTPLPFPNDFDTSFSSQTTIMPQTFSMSHDDMPYDLPDTTQSMHPSFMDGSVYPAPFQTSPRVNIPPQENPTLFLSSPARRFGGNTQDRDGVAAQRRPTLPAYHHQMQESRREKELVRERRRSRATNRQADEDVVMQSVRRALSPTKKKSRPSLTRSLTTQGLSTSMQRSNSLIDNVSLTSGSTSESVMGRHSSPIRKDHSRTFSASRTLRHRASMNLAIDARGTARAIMTALPEDESMNLDGHEDDGDTDVLSSDDEPHDLLYSFQGDPYHDMRTLGDARDELLSSNPYLGRGSSYNHGGATSATHSDSYDTATIRRPRTQTASSIQPQQPVHDNAQSALRAILQERSYSTSSHENQSSNSSMQFHSSPPFQHSVLVNYSNRSPGTLNDPNLLTPGTDVDSVSSISATRCICNSTSPDGNIMIQWYVSLVYFLPLPLLPTPSTCYGRH